MKRKGSQWLTVLMVALFLSAACASAPTGTPLGIMPDIPTPIRVAGEEIDSVMYVGVELRIAGTTLGGHYDGLAKVYQWPVRVGPEVESTWSRWMSEIGIDMLRSAGYGVKEISRIFYRSQSFSDVGFVLAGEATKVSVDTYGRLAGNKTVAALEISWELFDTRSRDVVYRKSIAATAETAGTSGDPIRIAFESIVSRLLADSAFVRAFRSRRPVVAADIEQYPGVNWRRAAPGESEILTIMSSDLHVRAGGTTFERVADAVVSVQGESGHGTAFVITKDGLALTNYHVIAGQRRLVARFRNGRQTPIRVLRYNENADVALVQIACEEDCITVRLSSEAEPTIGDEVLVIGTPFSIELGQTITKGIISGIRYASGVTLVQTDAAMNPGNSGGPIVSATSGEVVAITSSKLVGPDLEGLGFGIAIMDAMRILGIRYAEPE